MVVRVEVWSHSTVTIFNPLPVPLPFNLFLALFHFSFLYFLYLLFFQFFPLRFLSHFSCCGRFVIGFVHSFSLFALHLQTTLHFRHTIYCLYDKNVYYLSPQCPLMNCPWNSHHLITRVSMKWNSTRVGLCSLIDMRSWKRWILYSIKLKTARPQHFVETWSKKPEEATTSTRLYPPLLLLLTRFIDTNTVTRCSFTRHLINPRNPPGGARDHSRGYCSPVNLTWLYVTWRDIMDAFHINRLT